MLRRSLQYSVDCSGMGPGPCRAIPLEALTGSGGLIRVQNSPKGNEQECGAAGREQDSPSADASLITMLVHDEQPGTRWRG
jgi:hypothetical protein